MRTLIQDIDINSVKEAEEILKSAGTEDLFEKAHQDGDLHPTRPWIWVSSANKGKGDWRMNKNHKPNTPQELDERIKKMEEKKEGSSDNKQLEAWKKRYNELPDGHPDKDLAKKWVDSLSKKEDKTTPKKESSGKSEEKKEDKTKTEKLEEQKGKLSEFEEEKKKRK